MSTVSEQNVRMTVTSMLWWPGIVNPGEGQGMVKSNFFGEIDPIQKNRTEENNFV